MKYSIKIRLNKIKYVTSLICTVFLLYISLFFTGCTVQRMEQNKVPHQDNLSDIAWPHEESLLLPDPALFFARMDNGLRVITRKNKVPENRVALYLVVGAGALHEKISERGFAHFLEHMMFNGTEHFPPGDLITFFQEIGMGFGTDTNAHTGYLETVYKILLPDGSKAMLDKGILVLSDYAHNSLLLEDEVERERGVIFAEKLSRESPLQKMWKEARKNALAGTLLAEREIIGVDETIKQVDRIGLMHFYKKWYRPDNMVVIAVGDFENSELQESIESHFSAFKRPPEPLGTIDIGKISSKSLRTYHYHYPDAEKTYVSLKSYWNKDKEIDSWSLRRTMIKEYLASAILKERLKKISEESSDALAHAYAITGNLIPGVGRVAAGLSSSPDKWESSLILIENTLRSLGKFGPTTQELDREKNEVRAYYNSIVASEETRSSFRIVEDIVASLADYEVLVPNEVERNHVFEILQTIDKETIRKTSEHLWNKGDLLIEVLGATDLGKNWDHVLRTAYNNAKERVVEPYESTIQKKFPYLKAPQTQLDPEKVHNEDEIGVHQYFYGNNTVLSLKKTDFEKGKIRVAIHFGNGLSSELLSGMDMLGGLVLNNSGTSQMSQLDIDAALAGTTVEYRFSINESSLSLSGSALADESELLFATLYNLLQDPGIKKDIFMRKKEELKKYYQVIEKDVDGVDELYTDRILTGPESIFATPLPAEIDKVKFDDLQRWLLEQFYATPFEISVVGDIDEAKIVKEVTQLFSGLPVRDMSDVAVRPVAFHSGKITEKKIAGKEEKTVLTVAWQTDGFESIEYIRKMNMIAAYLEDGLRLIIRERLGAVYSPSVFYQVDKSLPDFGMIKARLVLHPDDLDKVLAEIDSLSKDVVQEGIAEKALKKIREPMVTALRDMLNNNRYWLGVLGESSRYPKQLQWPVTILSDIEKFTAKEISKLAKKTLTPDHRAVVIISSTETTN